MATRTRIPRSINDFNSYIINTNAYLLAATPTNASRLGITVPETTQWTAFVTQWTPLYAKYSDKKNSRTTSVKDQLLSIIKKCVDLDKANHILDRIASSTAVTIVDMEVFNIKKGVLQKIARTTLVAHIEETVVAGIQPLGGGSVAIKCHSTTGSRPAIYAGADCVQYMYQIDSGIPTLANASAMEKGLSSRASFTLSLGLENSGKNLDIYFRWYNTKHPELAGPWSTHQTTLIL